jgi:hypothetical protein
VENSAILNGTVLVSELLSETSEAELKASYSSQQGGAIHNIQLLVNSCLLLSSGAKLTIHLGQVTEVTAIL